jgi:hypothetical protein
LPGPCAWRSESGSAADDLHRSSRRGEELPVRIAQFTLRGGVIEHRGNEPALDITCRIQELLARLQLN